MFGAPPAAASSDSRASKRIAVSSDASVSMCNKKVDLALRMAVIATQKLREVEALTCSSIPITKAGKLNTHMMGAQSEYLKKAKGNKGHGLGDGSTYRFGALLIAIEECLPDGEAKAAIQDMITKYDPNSRVCVRFVRMCKTEVMHNSEQVRFKISIPSDHSIENQIIDAIESVEANSKQWVGPRPAGYLEIEGQKSLNGE